MSLFSREKEENDSIITNVSFSKFLGNHVNHYNKALLIAPYFDESIESINSNEYFPYDFPLKVIMSVNKKTDKLVGFVLGEHNVDDRYFYESFESYSFIGYMLKGFDNVRKVNEKKCIVSGHLTGMYLVDTLRCKNYSLSCHTTQSYSYFEFS
jgi:hypothetical protein